MRLPGAVSLAFLAYLCVLLPIGARRTAVLLKGQDSKRPVLSREKIWRSAVIVQLLLLFLAWFTGSQFGFRIFELGRISAGGFGLAAGALLAMFGLRTVLRRMRSDEELRGLAVYRRAPRTPREMAYFTLAMIAAAIAEEAAYRGVGWSILIYMFGDPWTTALVMSIVFGLAHWNQGWKSGIAIVGIALVLHGLVAMTGTLVFAMVMHAVYDLIAGHAIRKKALEFDRTVPAHGAAR
jgi:CAAX protease family protein